MSKFVPTLLPILIAASAVYGQTQQAAATSPQLPTNTAHSQEQHPADAADTVHYKGITVSPNGTFVELATVYRNRATGSDVTTAFSSIPLENSDAGGMSEFFMSGRQSRVALLAAGSTRDTTFRGYFEMDWLGTGVTSNNNESDSYVLRDRQLWAQVQTRSGWIITGGQMWSLPTEYTKGLMNLSEAIPYTIDANYHVGFVYTRQPSFRVVRDFGDRLWLGASLEQAQTLSPSCSGENFGGTATINCPTNYVLGAPGTGGGNYNNGGSAGTSAPLASYTYNLAPDVAAKIAIEPGYGHYEVFGIGRFFRNRVYPAGGTTGAWNDTTLGGGVGASARFPIGGLSVGVKGLCGDGTARYSASQLPDVTVRPDGQLSLIHNVSAMAFVEGHATHRVDIYAYYGVDYAGRDFATTSTGEVGYGLYTSNDSGCFTPAAPGSTNGAGYSPGATGTCQSATKDMQQGTVGYWFNLYAGLHGRLRQGLQYSYLQRYLWSGLGGASVNTNDNMIETSFRYYLP
jgi:hypothetical protein